MLQIEKCLFVYKTSIFFMLKKSCLLSSTATIPPCVIKLVAGFNSSYNAKFANPWGTSVDGDEASITTTYRVYVSESCGEINSISCSPNSARIDASKTSVLVDCGNPAGPDEFSLICYCQNATVQINAIVHNFT